tara:strand:+ start:887 stop:1150 length:264 start_codon:yes stop_codon:yes gene_type:complete
MNLIKKVRQLLTFRKKRYTFEPPTGKEARSYAWMLAQEVVLFEEYKELYETELLSHNDEDTPDCSLNDSGSGPTAPDNIATRDNKFN